MLRKLIAILNTPIFSTSAPAEVEYEYEFEPLEEPPKGGPFPSAFQAAPSVIQAPATTRIIIPIDDAQAQAQAPVLSAAQAELKVAKNSLQTMKEALAEAKAEAKVLDAVHETNQLVRQLAIEMGEQLLLPSQLEERRKAASADNESIAEMLKDLGF